MGVVDLLISRLVGVAGFNLWRSKVSILVHVDRSWFGGGGIAVAVGDDNVNLLWRLSHEPDKL